MKSAKELFNDWAKDHHAEGMEKEHWPAVRQAFEALPELTGNYLEIGVGNGYAINHMARTIFKDKRCIGLDISPEMVKRTEEKVAGLGHVKLFAGDFLTWQNPNQVKFGLIFSMEVFYYFKDIQKGIDKVFSLLDKDGIFLLLVNYYQENKSSHSWPEDVGTPMTLWSESDYKKGFKLAGFSEINTRIIPSGETKLNGTGTLCVYGKKK